MFCPQCGVEMSDASRFCFKCGKELPAVKQALAEPSPPPLPVINHAPPNDARSVFPAQIIPPEPAPEPEPEPWLEEPKKSTRRRTWTTVGALLFLLMMYFQIIDGALYGIEFFSKPNENVYVLIFGGWFFWWIFKAYGYNKWVGCVLGTILSFGVLVAGVAINKHTKSSVEYVMANTPQLAALQKHHPDDYAQITKDLNEAVKKGVTGDPLQNILNAKVTPIAFKAVRSTSEAAILDYGKTKLLMFKDVAAKNADDCTLLMSGDAQNAGVAVMQRILSYVTEDTKLATRKAIARVLEEEGSGTYDLETAEARSDKLYQLIDDKMKPTGSSAFYLADQTKSADVRCKSGIGVFEQVMSLPPSDRSFMLRYLLGAG